MSGLQARSIAHCVQRVGERGQGGDPCYEREKGEGPESRAMVRNGPWTVSRPSKHLVVSALREGTGE